MENKKKKKRVIPLTAKQEKFCQEYVKTGVLVDAYMKAYPATKNWTKRSIYTKSQDLKVNPKVVKRVNKLRLGIQKKYQVSLESIVEELMEDKAFAKKLENPSAMIKATELKAKLYGLLDRNRNKQDEVAETAVKLSAQALKMVDATRQKLSILENLTPEGLVKLEKLNAADEIDAEDATE